MKLLVDVVGPDINVLASVCQAKPLPPTRFSRLNSIMDHAHVDNNAHPQQRMHALDITINMARLS